MPAAAKVGLEPGGEVHGIRRGRNPDVTQVARAVTRWNIHAATEGDREVGVVATHAHALIEGFERGLGRPGMLVAEGDMSMDEIADCLDARPPRGRLPEKCPGGSQ